MVKIKKRKYEEASVRIEKLLPLVDYNTTKSDPNLIELVHFPIIEDMEYTKKIKKLIKSIKKKPLQFAEGFKIEKVRKLNRERDRRLIELSNEPAASIISNHNEKKNLNNLLKKACKKNIHKKTDTGKSVGNEEW